MKQIDEKILSELKSLTHEGKELVQAYIEGLKAVSASNLHATANSDSVAEDAGKYQTSESFMALYKSLPFKLQRNLMNYLKELKAQAEQEENKPRQDSKSKFKPGFGGAKGLFILKEGWDDPLDEEFKDYI